MADEFYDDFPPTSKCDLFSFTLILYEILVGKPVFERNLQPTTILSRLFNDWPPSVPTELLQFANDLMTNSCSQHPDNHPSFSDILTQLNNHDFQICSGVDSKTVNAYDNRITEYMTIVYQDWPDSQNRFVLPKRF
jgi:hypothetical protein